MATQQPGKPISKSAFLRKVLGKDPGLDHAQVNRRWAKAGHPGTISTALFYQVRSKMGIKTVWQWVLPERTELGPASTPSPKSPSTRDARPAYQLKVSIRDVRPPVWRRLVVADCSLVDLHEIIQVAIGWQQSHLYSFDVGGTSYTDHAIAPDLDMEDAARARLSHLNLEEKGKFRYTYDFGDNWEHDVLVEKVLPPEVGRPTASCLGGKRAGPPEDVGGPWGFDDFLAAIADPKHEQHDEMMEWSGGHYDPEWFDLEGVNKTLRRLG